LKKRILPFGEYRERNEYFIGMLIFSIAEGVSVMPKIGAGVSSASPFVKAGKKRPHKSRWLERFRAKHVLGLDPRMDTGSREKNASNQNS
jgi:hypothetical protein